MTLTIDDRKVTVPPGTTILQAAQKIKVDIPTLCYLKDFESYTSCMICVVHDIDSDQLIPACSVRVAEGMKIKTEDLKVQEARKDTLDLLLSEHVGNCEAPCQRACPAYMDIPLMIRHIKEQRFDEAIKTVKKNIALPAVLGRVCPAPCERGCNRKFLDQAISICNLKRIVADVDLSKNSPYVPERKKNSGKKVAIIGAGPTGLAAAYYLAQEGHVCHLFDRHEQPGGLLRYAIPDDRLDKTVLDAEIDLIKALGVTFKMKKTLGKDFSLAEMREAYNALILAIGVMDLGEQDLPGINRIAKGILVNKRTFETEVPGIFAGGNAISEGRMAIRSLGHGKFIASSVNQLLNNLPLKGFKRRFNSVMGHLFEGEEQEYVRQNIRLTSVHSRLGVSFGYTEKEAVQESERCFRCDCRKQVTCKLRKYADQYHASQLRFKTGERKRLEFDTTHSEVFYEPGKCIKCGLCIKITEKTGEKLGLTFVNRGYDIRVAVPLKEDMQKGLGIAAGQCVAACPTAALAWKDKFEETNEDID